jgi:Kef-type K+ transport system membrane component KefB
MRRELGTILNGDGYFLDHISLWLVQAIIIIGVTRTLAILGSYFKQPRVVFEIIGGILLGPSALGRNEYFLNKIFPKESLDYIGLIAEIGLVLYLFLIGLELDPRKLSSHAKKAGSIALVGIAVPFGFGIAISKLLMDRLLTDEDHQDVSYVSFLCLLVLPCQSLHFQFWLVF